MAALTTDLSHCCRPCLRRLIPHRSFTTSPARRKHGALPTLHETPSPELNTLLSTFRTTVFLPSHLIKPQRDLLYKKKHIALLTATDEPATVRLGAEVHPLRPLTHIKDEPNTRKSFRRVLELMQESGDWRNLGGWLEGLRGAGRKVEGWMMEKAVRAANEAGRVDVVKECLERVEKTGVGFGDLRVAREVVRGATVKAGLEGWSEAGVQRAARYAEVVWELMWDERHKRDMRGAGDAKRRPEVVGVLVQMGAARAKKGGEVEELQRFVDLLVGVWENGRGEMELQGEDWWDANEKLLLWAPVWHGITLAQDILGAQSERGKSLEKMRLDLEPLLQNAEAVMEAHAPDGGARRGLKMYESLRKVSM